MIKSIFYLSIFFPSFLFAGGIRGIVKGDDNKPLPFATIYVKQTGTGSASDVNELYEITLSPGRYDVYLHGGQKLWDYAAGSLILSESGGYACCIEHDDPSQCDIWQRSVIAARDHKLFEEWKSWIRAL